MRKHCLPWQPCKIFPKQGDASCPYPNQRSSPRRSKPSRQPVGHRPERLQPARILPDSWCGQKLLGQALKHAREILHRDVTAPLSHPTPETPVPRDDTGDTVFKVDPVTHLRLDTDPPCADTQMTALSGYAYSVPDDHAPEVLLAQGPRIDAPLIPEQGPDLIGGVVTMDDATFTTLVSLHSGVSTTSRFNCRALLDTGSPQSFIHEGAFDQMVTTGAADASCVRSTMPRM